MYKCIKLLEKLNYIIEQQEKITSKDLKVMFDEYNKKYWGGKLPKPKLLMAPLAKKFGGKFHYVEKHGIYGGFLITIATMFELNKTEVENILLHEMIHLWQVYMSYTKKDKKYLDQSFLDFILTKEANERGHREYFIKEMNRINSYGHNITITSDAPIDDVISKEYYLIVFDSNVALFSQDDPTKYMDDIIQQVSEIEGDQEGYTIYKSKNAAVLQLTRLTKSMKLPKNVLNIRYHGDTLKAIVKNNTQIHLEKDIKDLKTNVSGLPNDLISVTNAMHKHRSTTFGSYLSNILYNMTTLHPTLNKEFKKLNTSRDLGIKHNYKYGDKIELPTSWIDYVYHDWKNISDIEIKRSSILKGLSTTFRYAIISKDKKISPMDIKNIAYDYDSYFKERVDLNRYKKLAKEVLKKNLKKDFSKRPDSVSGNVNIDEIIDKVWFVVFKGSILENKKINNLKRLI